MSLYHEFKRRNVLRVGAAYIFAAWLIIQVAETIIPLFGFGDTPARIIVILLAIGFPLFLLFSWVFEFTPEGLKKEKDIDRAVSITHKTGKQLDRIIIVLLTLALGYFAFDKFVLSPQQQATEQQRRAEELATATQEARQEGRSDAIVESYGEKSIAVLPFINMSVDAGNEYFSDGISEELLNLLAKIPELRVISRSSAFYFKGEKINIPEVAKKLNVAHILEGSVRKAGNQVRITAQLIEARSDTHLWSETYDRELNDIFAVQDEIAIAVVDALKLTLLGDVPQSKPVDPEAYALYLQARYMNGQHNAEAYEKSIELYEQALAIDPDFAKAWRALAGPYLNQVNSGLRPFDEGVALAREAVNHALVIDPYLREAHGSLGWIAMTYYGDLAAAAGQVEYAMSLESGNRSRKVCSGLVGLMFKNLGRTDRAIASMECAVTNDPLNTSSLNNLAWLYLNTGRVDEAVATMRTVLMLAPSHSGAQYLLALVLLEKGELKTALKAMQQLPSELDRLNGLVMVYHALGQTAQSDATLTELIEKYGQDWPTQIASKLAYRGEADRSFEWLDKAAQQNDGDRNSIPHSQLFATLHDDPRWRSYLESIGRSPEQMAAIRFNVTLPD